MSNYTYLYDLLDDIRRGIEKMRQEASLYIETPALFDFINQKELDYIEFKNLVCRLGANAFMPDVIYYIKAQIASSPRYYAKTKYLGIAARGGDFFQLTKKLKKELTFKIPADTKKETAGTTDIVWEQLKL